MHRVLDLRVKILHAKGSAIKSGLAQSEHMVTRQAARIDLDPSFDIGIESELLPDKPAQLSDFIGREESRRAATPVELRHLAARVEQSPFLADVPPKVFNINI